MTNDKQDKPRASSKRRVNSSRAHGATSRGPVTPEGKARSSQNAITHGLCAEAVTITGEDPRSYLNLYTSYVHAYAPANPFEAHLLEEMAVAKWLQRRAWMLQNAAIDFEIHNQRAGLAEKYSGLTDDFRAALAYYPPTGDNHRLRNLERHSAHLSRQYSQCFKTLLAFRDLPPAAGPDSFQLVLPKLHSENCKTNLVPLSDTPQSPSDAIPFGVTRRVIIERNPLPALPDPAPALTRVASAGSSFADPLDGPSDSSQPEPAAPQTARSCSLGDPHPAASVLPASCVHAPFPVQKGSSHPEPAAPPRAPAYPDGALPQPAWSILPIRALTTRQPFKKPDPNPSLPLRKPLHRPPLGNVPSPPGLLFRNLAPRDPSPIQKASASRPASSSSPP